MILLFLAPREWCIISHYNRWNGKWEDYEFNLEAEQTHTYMRSRAHCASYSQGLRPNLMLWDVLMIMKATTPSAGVQTCFLSLPDSGHTHISVYLVYSTSSNRESNEGALNKTLHVRRWYENIQLVLSQACLVWMSPLVKLLKSILARAATLRETERKEKHFQLKQAK